MLAAVLPWSKHAFWTRTWVADIETRYDNTLQKIPSIGWYLDSPPPRSPLHASLSISILLAATEDYDVSRLLALFSAPFGGGQVSAVIILSFLYLVLFFNNSPIFTPPVPTSSSQSLCLIPQIYGSSHNSIGLYLICDPLHVRS
jgi:hypothetical protein